MNIEIQQRSCETLKLLDDKWTTERQNLYEPIPFKGDEGTTVDMGSRAVLDADEGEAQLTINKSSAAENKKKTQEVASEQHAKA